MKRINFRATDKDVALIDALKNRLGLTLTAVIRQAVRLLHKKEIDQVKNVLLVVALSVLAASCGGQQRIPPDGGLPPRATPTPFATPTPAPTPVPAITSAQAFSNTNQMWTFVDGFNHHMFIAVSPIACAFGSCGDITVWHYTKDACAGYWNPHTIEQCAVATTLDELYFVLRHDPDGAWRCIGFTYVNHVGVKTKVQINTPPGKAPPYTIVPPSSNVGDPDTSYDAIVLPLASSADLKDFSAINSPPNFSTTWRTDSGAETLGGVVTLVSLQHEGCVTERWNFANGGLIRVVPIVNLGNNGVCLPLPSTFIMERIP